MSENNPTQEHNTNKVDDGTTVSIRCMDKLVWTEVVIQAKRSKQNMNDYMKPILIKHLEELGIDVSNF
jgi:hypothetical protein